MPSIACASGLSILECLQLSLSFIEMKMTLSDQLEFIYF